MCVCVSRLKERKQKRKAGKNGRADADSYFNVGCSFVHVLLCFRVPSPPLVHLIVCLYLSVWMSGCAMCVQRGDDERFGSSDQGAVRNSDRQDGIENFPTRDTVK